MTIDNIIVLLYLISILVLGIYHRSRLIGFANYATVQNKIKNSKILLVATIFTSSVGGATTLGIAEKAFSGDLSYSYGLILSLPIDILIAIYLVPQITKHYGAESIGDIMAKYYGKTGHFIAGITAIIVSIGFVAAQISVSGYIFQYILKINYLEGTILSYGIVIIYTTIGGLQSIMFTNLLQFFVMIIALPIIAICGLNKIGISEFIHQLPIEKVYFIHHNNFASELFINTITVMLGFYVMNLYPIFIQRALINNNAKKTSNAIYIKSGIYAIFLIFITLNGLIAYNLYPNYSSNLALPHLIDQIVPSGLQGFVIVGLLASVMSTADSDLNVTSIALVKDLLSPIFKVQNQKKLLLIARITNVVIGSFAIIIALNFNNVIDLVVFITGFWGPIILVPLIFALFNITITPRMMILCGLSGVTSFFIWTYFLADNFRLKGVFIGTMCSLLVFCIGLFRKKLGYVTKI
ncbi:MAG: sodium:solute symporter family protein [Rickettsia sp.]|jgi:Na+/proline symporter|nr:sodium:solute symporter family protein [Rickettsia sp.]